MVKRLIYILLLMVFWGCASSNNTSKNVDGLLLQTLSHPNKYEDVIAPSRYWIFDKYIVHFITNVSEKNKNQVPFVFVHGLNGSVNDYAELIKTAQKAHFSHPYYAIDLPPFGQSMMKETELSIQGYSDLLQEFILNLGVPKVNLVCHSMGGQVCINFALRNPAQIQLLTLVSPAGVYEKNSYVNQTLNYYLGISVGSVDSAYAKNVGDLSWYSQDFTRKMITTNPAVLMAIESYRNNFHLQINRLKTKTLIIWGREDTVFSYENGLFLKENIENSALHVLNGADHNSLQSHAELIFNLIKKYL